VEAASTQPTRPYYLHVADFLNTFRARLPRSLIEVLRRNQQHFFRLHVLAPNAMLIVAFLRDLPKRSIWPTLANGPVVMPAAFGASKWLRRYHWSSPKRFLSFGKDFFTSGFS
jgi:hypothetical protein